MSKQNTENGETKQNPSTQLIAPTRWASGDFMLSAGCCMIQPSTGKVVVVKDTSNGRWFLPRGRKDVGETLEQAAFREGYEESGFRPHPLPLLLPHRQPDSPLGKALRKANPTDPKHRLTTTEPVYITTDPVPSRSGRSNGFEYTSFWYAASLPEDAVREENTGMDDEKSYVGTLLHVEDALRKLHDPENYVVWFTYNTWLSTREALKEEDTNSDDEGKTPTVGDNNTKADQKEGMSAYEMV